MLIASLTASVADSANDMLAAGRIDDAIAELNGRLSSAPADAESSNLLCRAYFALGIARNRRAKKRWRSTRAIVVSIFGWGAYTAKRRIGQISCLRLAWPEKRALSSNVQCS